MKKEDLAQFKELVTVKSKASATFNCLVLEKRYIDYAVIVHHSKKETTYTILVDMEEKEMKELQLAVVNALYCLL